MHSVNYTTATRKGNVSTDFARVLRQIESLRVMTVGRGCTTAEAEVAARKIGESVQRYGLVVRPPASPPQVSKRALAIPGIEAIAETERALLCVVNDEELWVPKSQITEDSEVTEKGDFGTLIVTRWFAARAGLWPRRRV